MTEKELLVSNVEKEIAKYPHLYIKLLIKNLQKKMTDKEIIEVFESYITLIKYKQV